MLLGDEWVVNRSCITKFSSSTVPLIGTDYPRCGESAANIAPPTLPQFSLFSGKHTGMRIISQIYNTDVIRRILGEGSPGRVQ